MNVRKEVLVAALASLCLLQLRLLLVPLHALLSLYIPLFRVLHHLSKQALSLCGIYNWLLRGYWVTMAGNLSSRG